MKIISFILLALLCKQPVYAIHVGVGQFIQNMEAQDASGSKVTTPKDFFLSVGKNFVKGKSSWGIFAPMLGFVRHEQTDDTYGDHTKETIFLLYDLALPLHKNLIFRYGIGNFITNIKGDGGRITVPNGANGTSTAYRPGAKSESFSTTVNLGLEFFSAKTPFAKGKGLGGRIETFMFAPLNSEKRAIGYLMMVSGYF
jgi:hypothetical protein